jgi:hypothetical protein
MFALAVIYSWDIKQIDIKSVFLYRIIDKEVFIELPEY